MIMEDGMKIRAGEKTICRGEKSLGSLRFRGSMQESVCS